VSATEVEGNAVKESTEGDDTKNGSTESSSTVDERRLYISLIYDVQPLNPPSVLDATSSNSR